METQNFINKNLVESAKKEGFIVSHQDQSIANKFGSTDVFVLENERFIITVKSNVLHGTNYFSILVIKDNLKNRMLYAQRYHLKFIRVVTEIIGNTYIRENK